VEILETPEERRQFTEPTAKEPATGEAFVETIVVARTIPAEIVLEVAPSSKVDSPVNPTIDVSLAETVAARVTSPMETTPATTISTGVTTADTSAPSGNDRKNLATNFLYTVSSFFNSKAFSQKP